METQIDLPREYKETGTDKLSARIAERKARLGDELCILGHHYQSDEVIRFADFTGDSLKLSQLAARQSSARYIVFCGVHFMAESADILSADEQVVILPNLHAGCAMAEMADDESVAAALEELAKLTNARIVPVTYVNSSAAIKAITGRCGGACCTSGNVENVFRWALADEQQGGAGADKILSIPDQHLGRNTAVAMGYSLDDCVVYDPDLPGGGLSEEDLERATVILWKGHCYVHQLFYPEQVHNVRGEHPDVTVIVHPECPYEVVQLADAAGSTEQIIRAIEGSDVGSKWAIGTETALVERLAKEYPDRLIRLLSETPPTCVQMKRIDLAHLLWVLDNLTEGNVVNQIAVPPQVAFDARVALKRMIDIHRVDDVTPTHGDRSRM